MKNKNLQLEILDINSSATGTAKIDGFVYFVPYTIDKETVVASPKKMQKNFCITKLEQVLLSSPDRIKPKCKYFGLCGGCDFQHMKYQKQLQTKYQIVKSAFEKSNLDCSHICPVVGCENNFFYRNKINFNIVQNKLCFFDVDNNPIFVESCPLFCDKNIDKIIKATNNFLQNANANFKALHIRVLENQLNFCFVSNQQTNCNFDKLINYFQNTLQLENFSICTSVNCNKQSSNISKTFKTVFGNPTLIADKNFDFKISPLSFLQTNTKMQNVIYQKICDFILPNQTVINAYGGAGLLSALISQKCKFVYSVEISKSSSKDCENLFIKNKITNAKSICGDCKNVIPDLAKQNIDTVVFDPARAGIDNTILETITNCKIKNIVYLSCNLQTFVRDVSKLNNYKIVSVIPYDMFPQTKHIEILALLQLK